jgi:hypothetical protein
MTSEKVAASGEVQAGRTYRQGSGCSVAYCRSLSAENARQPQTTDRSAPTVITGLANPTPADPAEIRARLVCATIRL